MTLIFGHKSPDTDSTGSPIVWAWYLNEIKGVAAEPKLLGEPNTEAAFMLERWGLEKPAIIEDVAADAPVVIVDTNTLSSMMTTSLTTIPARRGSPTTSGP